MAFRTRRRGFRRTFRRRRPLTRWHGVFDEGTHTIEGAAPDYIDNQLNSIVLVEAPDYQQGGTSTGASSTEAKGARVVRVVGNIVYNITDLNGETAGDLFSIGIIFGICRVDHNAATIGVIGNPGLITQLAQEDWMWLRKEDHGWRENDLASTTRESYQNRPLSMNTRFPQVDFDIKVGRRLDAEDIILTGAISMVGLQAETGDAQFDWVVHARVLLAGNF